MSSELSLGQNELAEIADKKQFKSLLDHAYQYLMRREHSEFELRQKLERWDDNEHMERAIKLLQERKAQSDMRFAEHLARVRFNAGKGPAVLKNEFSQHRIDAVIIEEVMAAYDGQWAGLARSVREKKFGAASPEDYKSWARQARFLQQRGFSARDIPGFEG